MQGLDNKWDSTYGWIVENLPNVAVEMIEMVRVRVDKMTIIVLIVEEHEDILKIRLGEALRQIVFQANVKMRNLILIQIWGRDYLK